MGKTGIGLKERLWIDESFLFQDETLTPVFCKPKLIPLKTITMQKLEKMQKEFMEKLQFPISQKQEMDDEEHPEDPQPSTSETKSTDVWTADD